MLFLQLVRGVLTREVRSQEQVIFVFPYRNNLIECHVVKFARVTLIFFRGFVSKEVDLIQFGGAENSHGGDFVL